MDPELQQTSGEKASIQELTDGHITRLNLHYSTMSQQQIRYSHSLMESHVVPHNVTIEIKMMK